MHFWQRNSFRSHALIACALWLLSLGTGIGADERLHVDGKINGKPVRLYFDTGSEMSVLMRASATNLGLRIIERPAGLKVPEGKAPMALAEPCQLTIGISTTTAWFAVLDLPPGLHMTDTAGILGWNTFKDDIVRLDCLNKEFSVLDRVPNETAGWLKFRMPGDASVLAMKIPDPHCKAHTVYVDSGNDRGISLNPDEWRQWTAAHPHRPKTITGYYMPGSGLQVQEESWIDQIAFGQLILTDVPVREANVSERLAAGLDFRASLGLRALERLVLVSDGKKNVAYVSPRQTGALPCPHNRLGAVFAPSDPNTGDALIGHVIDGAPAYEAGIRNGDLLLSVDGQDFSHFRTSPQRTSQAELWSQPAGTKIRLTLKRGDHEFEATVVLRDLIGPKLENQPTNEATRNHQGG